MWEYVLNWMNGTMAVFERAQEATYNAATRSFELSAFTSARLMGQVPDEVIPDDRRFEDDVWRENLTAEIVADKSCQPSPAVKPNDVV